MCTVYAYDRENNILFTLDAAGGEHRIPVNDKTIAGMFASTVGLFLPLW
jgi:hypothetical protein